jgi:hypothetical protein
MAWTHRGGQEVAPGGRTPVPPIREGLRCYCVLRTPCQKVSLVLHSHREQDVGELTKSVK